MCHHSVLFPTLSSFLWARALLGHCPCHPGHSWNIPFSVHPHQGRFPFSNPKLLSASRQPPPRFRPPLTSPPPSSGPVSSCPAGGVACPRGSSSGCTQVPGGWSGPPRLHLAGEAEELCCGGWGQLSGCHVFRKQLIFWESSGCTRTMCGIQHASSHLISQAGGQSTVPVLQTRPLSYEVM